MAVGYEQIHLHSARGDPEARIIRRHLEDVAAVFVDLEFDDLSAELRALNTWFKDKDGLPIIFIKGPVVTYREVLWVNPDDLTDLYAKTKYATSVDDLPAEIGILSR